MKKTVILEVCKECDEEYESKSEQVNCCICNNDFCNSCTDDSTTGCLLDISKDQKKRFACRECINRMISEKENSMSGVRRT